MVMTSISLCFKNHKEIIMPRTLSRWYTVIDGKTGFTFEAFETLKQKVANDKHVCCNLIIDEMCVKRFLESDTH
jgi:DNA transposase THAP9